MIALVVLDTVLVLVLAVLVAGLLRGYATVLNRLHQLDSGGAPAAGPPFQTVASVPEPDAHRIQGRQEWAPAHDVAGVSLHGEIVSARTVGVEHDTVLAFLSSTCEGCTGFWHELARPEVLAFPDGTRLLVVTKGPEAESPPALAELCPPGVDVVMSSEAWTEFEVPGSPYVVITDGRTGRIKGEGSGTSFSQIGGLIQQATQDSQPLKRFAKPPADREREEDVDRVLLSAGIGPSDPSLYQPAVTRAAELDEP
jgi:hypothetical protein